MTSPRIAPHIPPPSEYGGAHLPPKHLEVLRVAMRLIAERGYRGASLRELARRVGMQQPSLYHYFSSKEDLVEQILVTFGFGGVGVTPSEGRLPERIEDFPALCASIATWLYERTEWPHFVRLLFNIAIEAPKYQPRLRELFVGTTSEHMRMMTLPYVQSGQIGADDAENLTRMVVNAIGLPLIEQYLLFPRAGDHPNLDAYVAFVVRFTAAGLRSGVLADRTPVVLPKVGSPVAESQTAAAATHPPAAKGKQARAKRAPKTTKPRRARV